MNYVSFPVATETLDSKNIEDGGKQFLKLMKFQSCLRKSATCLNKILMSTWANRCIHCGRFSGMAETCGLLAEVLDLLKQITNAVSIIKQMAKLIHENKSEINSK